MKFPVEHLFSMPHEDFTTKISQFRLKKITPINMHEFLHKINTEAIEGFKFYR